MSSTETFTLGPFLVEAGGRLRPARSDQPPGFRVRWRGRVVHAVVTSDGSDGTGNGRLRIETILGRVPSTSPEPSSRLASLRTLRDLAEALPDTWTIRLLPDYQPRLDVETAIELPITVTNLVTELTTFLLDLSPYLDLMDQAGLQPASQTNIS